MTGLLRFWPALLVCTALAGASPAHADDNRVWIYKIQDDKFSKRMSFEGKTESIIKLIGTTRHWGFRTWIDKKTLEVTHQLVVDINYQGEWKYYQSAANDQAEELEFTSISRTVNSCGGLFGCDLNEEVGVGLTDTYLRARATTGFQLKLSAKSSDSLIIDVTPAQIQSELLTENQVLPPALQWTAPQATPAVAPASAAVATATSPSAAPAGAATLSPQPPASLGELLGPPWGPIAYTKPVSLAPASHPRSIARLKAALGSQKWQVAEADDAAGTLTTALRDIKLTGKEVDCGSMIGIPYIIDGRAKTQIVVKFNFSPSGDTLVVGARGYYKTGYGNADKVLTCRPKDGLAERIAAAALDAQNQTAGTPAP